MSNSSELISSEDEKDFLDLAEYMDHQGPPPPPQVFLDEMYEMNFENFESDSENLLYYPEDDDDEEEEEEEEERIDQYGGGGRRRRIVLPVYEPSGRYIVRTTFPTATEVQYFRDFTRVLDSVELKRISGGIVEADCIQLLFENFDNLPSTKSLDQHVRDLFDIFIRGMIQKAGGDLKKTKYWLCLRHPDWPGNEIWINHRTHAMANGHTLMNAIAKIMMSNKELQIDKMLQLHMKIFTPTPMQGKGGPLSEQVLKVFGITRQIVVGDGFCLPKALALGKIWSDWKRAKNGSEEWNKLNLLWRKVSRSKTSESRELCKAKHQACMAQDLLIQANMDPYKNDHDLSDLAKLADHLFNYQIVVWTANETNVPTVLTSFNENAPGFIGLIFINNHYEFFIPKCYKIKTRFCFNCSKLVDKIHSVKCKAKCQRCGMLECEPDFENIITCAQCNIDFNGEQCYKQHLEKRSMAALEFCKIWEKCHGCFKISKRCSYSHVKHVCGADKFCPICQEMVKNAHECHHALTTEAGRKKLLARQEQWTMVIYDFECIVSVGEPNKTCGPKHEVNLVTFRLICEKCVGNFCVQCGSIQYFSYNKRLGEVGTVLDRFCNFLTSDLRLKNAYVIAHNGGRYDHVFLLAALTQKTDTTPDFICSGSTFISATLKLKDRTLTFRDSCQYMPMKLAKMPEAFGLPVSEKGRFPYLLNFIESYGKTWPTKPPKMYYQPEYMSEKDAADFNKWYDETYDEQFDFDDEILKYGLSDTEILTSGICKYIMICASTFGNWNPIIQAPTLAGFVMFVLSMEHFAKDDVGYIPENGFPGRNNSQVALKYLRWLENQDPSLSIQHSLNGDEYKIANYYVDGFDALTNTVFEVYGCMWHGCPRCYHNRSAKCPRRKDDDMQKLYDETIARQSNIEALGYKVRAFWECEIDQMLAENAQMSKFFKRCRNTYNLLPREGMFGGRTQPFQTFAEEDDENTIEYYDFCSLYPYINMKGAAYPKGQPIVETVDFCPIEPNAPIPYRGLVYCDVLPPSQLDLPVLPYRSNGKLLFPLCRSCAERQTLLKCVHFKISERYLTGIWTSEELDLAISKGYTLLKYHETWHWPDEKWCVGGFFAKFLGPLLVIKHQASGWPRANMTDEEKTAHVQWIEQNDGVRIDPNLVEKNPALRSLAKLFLNSAWGKFAQNPSRTETRLMKLEDFVEISKFFEATGYEPKVFKTWGSDMAFVSRKLVKDALATRRFTNIMYGIITTSAARIRLYSAMERVGAKNLIYCDTDSVLFLQKRGQDLLGDLKGDGLGMLTNEVPKGKRIVQVVTAAPKVYALKFMDDDGTISHSIKAKGITLNKKSSETVTFDSMKKMMESWVEKRTVTPLRAERFVFKRGTNQLDGIETVFMEKVLRPVSDKGSFTTSGRMVPFGTLGKDATIVHDYQF